MSQRYKLAAVCVAVSLTGCGGGGSSAETAKPSGPPPIPTSILTVSESNTEERHLPGEFAELSGQVSDDRGLIKGSLTSGNLTVTVAEVDRPSETTAVVTTENGDVIGKLNVLVVNTSAVPVVQNMELLNDRKAQLLALSDLKALNKLLVDAAYLGSVITAQEQDATIAQFDPSQLTRYAQAVAAFDEATLILQQYKNGEVGDTQLDPAALIAELNFLAQEGYAVVEATRQAMNSPLSIPQNYNLVVNGDSGTVSRFIGQPDLGSWSNEQWTFSEAYQHLSLIK